MTFQPAIDYIHRRLERSNGRPVQIKMKKLMDACELSNQGFHNERGRSPVAKLVDFLRSRGFELEFFDWRRCGLRSSDAMKLEYSIGSVYTVTKLRPVHSRHRQRGVYHLARGNGYTICGVLLGYWFHDGDGDRQLCKKCELVRQAAVTDPKGKTNKQPVGSVP